VDDQAQGKGPLVRRFWEDFCDLCDILGACGLAIAQECDQGCEGVDDVDLWWDEFGEVVHGRALFVEIGLVDEVPRCLKAAKATLDVVGERRTLCERMVSFMLDQVRVALCQLAKLLQGFVQDAVFCVLGKDGLGPPRDKKMTLTPECLST